MLSPKKSEILSAMKKLLLITLLSTPFHFAHAANTANFSGHWLATTGKLSSTVGFKADCTHVEIIIEQNETSLVTKLYKADCGMYSPSWGPVTQTIHEGKVFEGEDEVGTISSDTLMTLSRSGTAEYAYNLKLIQGADGKPVMETYYGARTSAGAMVVEGNLERVRQ